MMTYKNRAVNTVCQWCGRVLSAKADPYAEEIVLECERCSGQTTVELQKEPEIELKSIYELEKAQLSHIESVQNVYTKTKQAEELGEKAYARSFTEIEGPWKWLKDNWWIFILIIGSIIWLVTLF